ncbi:hypothetical protein WA026_014722 [Henosepilachna vigintioctopunctata]|uniref:Uncharacterized protein n=1 Tax=Henosepilachna vigintioctopunctata TaxID=420089 RepID=A0AAW1VGP7_9CUCU
MYGRTDSPGRWSVYAEFTISHPGVGDPENVPVTRTEQNDNGGQTWRTSRNAPSETESNRSAFTDGRFEPGSYGFQKGNLVFTSTPPSRRPSHFQTPASSRVNAPESSGYSSNLLSPNSMSSSTSVQHHEGSRCRSTCNITLNANPIPVDTCHHHCGRTQSLRCQTPSSKSDYKNAYYGCGDPWCHHLRSGDDYSVGGRCSPVLEICEDCPSLNGRSHKATRSLSRELDGRKDVSVQTFEMVDKCTSPYMKVEDDGSGMEKKTVKSARKVRRKSLSSYQRKNEPIYQRSQSPSSFTPDSLESGRYQLPKRISRSPKLKRMPHVKGDVSDPTTSTATAN